MHKNVKEFDEGSKTVYLTAGYRVILGLPEPVKHTIRQKQNAGDINYKSEDGETVVKELLDIIASESQVVINMRLSKAYAKAGQTQRRDDQDIIEYAETYKGIANQYLTMAHASESSVTSEQLAHLMLTNANLAPDVHASALMRLTSIVSDKKVVL